MNVTNELKELLEQDLSRVLCIQVHINKGYGVENNGHERVLNLSVGYSQTELKEFLKSQDYDTDENETVHTDPSVTVWFANGNWATLELNEGGMYHYWYLHAKPDLV